MKTVAIVFALFVSVLSVHGQVVPGDTFRDCDACPLMVVIPAGDFEIGSPESEIGRNNNETVFGPITLGRDFALGKFEVTNEEWMVCADNNGCPKFASKADPDISVSDFDRHPIVGITKPEMQRYLAWISQHTGQTYRLPSEAEWEYAARAGTHSPYHMGEAVTNQSANILVHTAPGEHGVESSLMAVGSFEPNAYGLHDMHGNVSEVVADCYSDWYGGVPQDGSALTAPCIPFSIHRGGSWRSSELDARSAHRGLLTGQDDGADDRGFRIVRVIE